MDRTNYDEFFLAGVQLVELAAEISQRYFRTAVTIDSKDGLYPVTVADREIESCLRMWLKKNYPEHGVIGEEYATENRRAKYTWVIDPIDGTVAFASGKPIFSTLVALLEDDKPVLGILDQAVLGERFIGVRGAGAWLDGVKISANTQHNLAEARLNATTPYMFKTDTEKSKFEKLRQQVGVVGWGGDSYAYGLLAKGHIDVIMEADLGFYDVAALTPIIEESGGIITDWAGAPITYKTFAGQCIACSNKTLHTQVLEVINSYEKDKG